MNKSKEYCFFLLMKLLLVSLFIVLIVPYLPAQSAVVTNYYTYICIKGDEKCTTQRVRIKVNNPQGDYLSLVQIPYNTLTKLKIKHATLQDKNFKVLKKIKKSDLITRSSIAGFSFFEDNYEMVFRLKHYEYPYYIDYEFEHKTKTFVTVSNWLPVLDIDIPTLSATLEIENKTDLNLTSKIYNIDNPEFVKLSNAHFRYKTAYLKTIDDEIYSPNAFNSLPKIVVTPELFYYHNKGLLNSWCDYGLWESSLLEGKKELKNNEKKKINELTDGCTDTLQILQILYEYLKEKTRYVNISLETGGHVPYPASYVCKNSYGDCKALTNYLKSVYEFVGIKSYYSVIYASVNTIEIDTTMVYPQFNHVILFIPLKKDTVWLDCTSDGPFNYLGTYNQNRLAFIVDGENSHFLMTPAFTTQDVVSHTTSKIHINDKQLNTTSVMTYGGRGFEILSNYEHHNNKIEFEKFIYETFETNGLTIDSFQVQNNQKLKQYNIIMKGIINNHLLDIGSELIIKPIRNILPTLSHPDYRDNKLYFGYPINRRDSLIIQKPSNTKYITDGIKQTIKSKFGEYFFCIYEDTEAVYVTKSLKIEAGEYPVEAYPDFYDFISNATDIEKKFPIVIKRVQDD